MIISSYNETLSGETLSSMSEKSDSYFTTDLESRCTPDRKEKDDSAVVADDDGGDGVDDDCLIAVIMVIC